MLAALTQLRDRHLRDRGGGIVSVCSSHPTVIEAAMAAHADRPLLIEVTPNQVNPAGGYSGMTPAQFSRYLSRLAQRNGFPAGRLILGADHLGPHVWKHLDAQTALTRTADMATACVAAGFQKIHLDTAVACADDADTGVGLETAARRAVKLCLATEQAARACDAQNPPVYVIGQDVPQAGGGLDNREEIRPTAPEELARTLDCYATFFSEAGLSEAWRRVVAVVVQPGVDFNDHRVARYRPDAAAALSACHDRLPGMMTFEAHATDYQTPDALKQMVHDHFCLLKVGPCLTFAFREAVYALARLESAWSEVTEKSDLVQVMDAIMLSDPRHLSPEQREHSDRARRLRYTSLRDRIRYYWNHPQARKSLQRLLLNLDRPLPQDLLQRFLPGPEAEFHRPTARELILRRIQIALEPYLDACRGSV